MIMGAVEDNAGTWKEKEQEPEFTLLAVSLDESSQNDLILRMEDVKDIDFLKDPRPPSVLQRIINDPQDDMPFSDIPPAPTSYNGSTLADWIKQIDSVYFAREDRPLYCTIMYALSNGGTFSMDMVPKSFRYRDLPKLEEDDWVKSYQYIAETLDLDLAFLKHDKIKETANSLSEVDKEGRGPFFTKAEGDKYSFSNEVVHIAANISYCNLKQYRGLSLSTPVFVYRYCYTSLQYMELNNESYDFQRTIVSIHNSDEILVFRMFINELCKGKVYDTLASRMWTEDRFCRTFMKHLKDDELELNDENKIEKMFTAIDTKSTGDRPKSLLYCLVAQNPPRVHILEPFLTAMMKHCTAEFMHIQYLITMEYCCRNALIDIYLLLAPKVKTLSFSFIRSAIMGGDSILLDRVLCHQTWDQEQLNKAMQWVAMSGKFEDYLHLKQVGAVADSVTVYESIMGKNISLFEDILRDGLDIEADVYDGRKAIHAAAEVGNSDMVDMLLQRGVDLGTRSNRNEIPMYLAIDYYHEDLAENFLRRGADPNERDYRGATALIRACAKGMYRLAERLMYVGSDANDVDNQGCNILHKAYISGVTEVIEFAKTHGFKDDFVDRNKNTTLHFSALSGVLKKFQELLNKMPSMISASNVNGWSLVSCAAICGRWNIFEFLKKNGADMQQRTIDGLCIRDLAKHGRTMRVVSEYGYIEEYNELITLSSLENFDKIIAACDN